MRKNAFSLYQGLKRVIAHPWLSFVFFCAIISIGAIIGAMTGCDSFMLEPSMLPYQHREQVLRLMTDDEALLDTMMNTALEGIEKRCLVEQQDVQCFSETQNMILRIQTVISDEKNVLTPIELAPDEAGMTRTSLHYKQLKEGDKLTIDGVTYTIKKLPCHLDPGVDVLLTENVPNGMHSYIVELELAEGITPAEFKDTLASAWNLALFETAVEGAVQYEIPSVTWQKNAENIQKGYTFNLLISMLGVLFGVSQLSALMSYLISKCSMRNALSLRWTGHRGLLLEFGTTITLLVWPALPIGFVLGTYLQTMVGYGSPALQEVGRLALHIGIATLGVWVILLLLLCYQIRHWHEQTAMKGEES